MQAVEESGAAGGERICPRPHFFSRAQEMTLKTQIAADVAAVFLQTDDFAETVTYTPVGGAGASMTVLFFPDPMSMIDLPDGNKQATLAAVYVAETDVVTPQRGDQVTRTNPASVSETWRVDVWQEEDGMWLMTCKFYDEREMVGAGARQRSG